MTLFEQWMEAWQQAYHLPPDIISVVRCPNCGARELQMRLYTYNPKWRAHGAFWCGKCLEGLALGPCAVSAAYNLVRHEDANIPNFRLVPPDSRDGRGS